MRAMTTRRQDAGYDDGVRDRGLGSGENAEQVNEEGDGWVPA